jgi:hypothetical protein
MTPKQGKNVPQAAETATGTSVRGHGAGHPVMTRYRHRIVASVATVQQIPVPRIEMLPVLAYLTAAFLPKALPPTWA